MMLALRHRNPITKATGDPLSPINIRTLRNVEQLATRMEPALRAAFLAAIRSARSNTTLEILEQALQTFDPAAAIRAASNGIEFGAMQETLAQIVEAAGRITTENLRPLTGEVLARFDLMNPYARTYARRETAEMVREITQTTKEGIRAIVERSFLEGIPPAQSARQIKQIIGLTEFQSNAVVNYRARLMDEGVSGVEGKVQRYADKVLRDRALNIARTEGIDASNAGQQAAWNSAVDQGLLPADAEQRWLVSRDERLCKICAPMPTMEENQHVKLGGYFITGDGRMVKRPPGPHPRCRCDLRLAPQ